MQSTLQRPKSAKPTTRQIRTACFAEGRRHFKSSAVANQTHDIACAVMDGGAMFAGFEMRFDPGAQLGLDTVIQIVRDFTPDLNATDLNSHVIQSVLAHQSRTF
jgi:hypothetical protein